MIYEVFLSKEAERDLRTIYEYVLFELAVPDSAQLLLNKLEKSIIDLQEFPMRHKRYDTEPWASRNVRIMPIENYLIFYIVYDNGTVMVLRVLYSKRNVDEQLSNCTKYLRD